MDPDRRQFHVTPQQDRILRLIARGNSDKQIAGRLGISRATVRAHLDRLYKALGVTCRAEAVVRWLVERQLEDDDANWWVAARSHSADPLTAMRSLIP